MHIVIVTAVFSVVLAFVLGVALGIFRRVFHVEEDALIGAIRETLPGANCGACGFPGCDGFAAAVAERSADPSLCSVSGADSTKKRAALLGVDAVLKPVVAIAACRGSADVALSKGTYTGVKSCRAAKISSGGTKLCSWGCMGFGDCIGVCKFGAIAMGEDGIPVIDRALCTGCKQCIAACPQGLIRELPQGEAGAFAMCANRNVNKAQVRKFCSVGCIKCSICEKKCPAGALAVKNGIPEIDYSKCTKCGTCVEACPQKVLVLLGE
jgi:Na+-translocating ferredoxin:NAD+ oxidoreductase RNF subunit RnfB